MAGHSTSHYILLSCMFRSKLQSVSYSNRPDKAFLSFPIAILLLAIICLALEITILTILFPSFFHKLLDTHSIYLRLVIFPWVLPLDGYNITKSLTEVLP